MKRVLIVLILLSFFSMLSYGQKSSFAKKEIKNDLSYLKEKFLAYHPNLFVYSSLEEFDSFFLQTEQSIPDKTSEREAFRMFSKASSVIKDGHTVFLPKIEPSNPVNTQSKRFPFQIHWDGEAFFIFQNYSKNTSIKDGDQVLRINRKNTADIVAEMLESLMRDGNNQTYPTWVLNTYFSEYFGHFFGYPAGFELEMLDTLGKAYQTQVKALNQKEMISIRQFRYNIFEAEGLIDIRFEKAKNTAILRIKSWDNKRIKAAYNKSFAAVIRGAFREVSKHKVDNLILDLRNNQGGDIKSGKILLSYLLEQPFELVEGYKKLNKRQELVSCKGPQKGTHKGYSKTFEGKVFVLINGGSFSNTGIVSQALQKYKRAVFIGEETGGSAYVLAGSIKNIVLPNTQVRVQIPQLRFTLQSDSRSELSGVQPEHQIEPNITDLVQGKDTVLEFAFDLIDK